MPNFVALNPATTALNRASVPAVQTGQLSSPDRNLPGRGTSDGILTTRRSGRWYPIVCGVLPVGDAWLARSDCVSPAVWVAVRPVLVSCLTPNAVLNQLTAYLWQLSGLEYWSSESPDRDPRAGTCSRNRRDCHKVARPPTLFVARQSGRVRADHPNNDVRRSTTASSVPGATGPDGMGHRARCPVSVPA